MKTRNLILLAALVGSLAPVSAQAEHCQTPIYLFSRTRIENSDPAVSQGVPSLTSSAIGCTVSDEVPELNTEETHPATDTDLIYPGANFFEVRLLDNGNDPAAVDSATLQWVGETIELEFEAGTDVTGAAAPWLDSQRIQIDPVDTLGRNDAVVTICLSFDPDNCLTRTYRTVI